jgi:hypothetical protein
MKAGDRWTAGLAFAAGLVPILSVHAAYAINVAAETVQACNPYWDGCLSVSRAVRSGPGLWLFKAVAVPIALLMVLTWRRLGPPVGTQAVRWLGTLGAAFFVVYALALGTEGDLYRWMRRYGVVFYFGMTGLSQLLVGAALRRHQAPRAPAAAGVARSTYFAVLFLTWGVGIASAFKRRLIDDPTMVDRVQSALEWWFALGLSLGFVALSGVIYQACRSSLEEPKRQ